MDRDTKIFKRLEEHYQVLLDRGYNVAAMFVQGSQNYDMDIYTDEYMSDIDTKAILVPTFDEIVNGAAPKSTVLVLDNNEHIEVKDIRVMMEMFKKQNLSYLELLYSKYKIINETYKPMINKLLDMRDDISNINRNQFLRCVCGMSMEKYKALEHPYEGLLDKIAKYGYDPKQLHHIVRLNDFLNQFADGTPLVDCYFPTNKNYLMDLKLGKFSLEEAREIAIKYDTATKELKDSLLTTEDVVRHDVINAINEIKKEIVALSLKRELLAVETLSDKTSDERLSAKKD